MFSYFIQPYCNIVQSLHFRNKTKSSSIMTVRYSGKFKAYFSKTEKVDVISTLLLSHTVQRGICQWMCTFSTVSVMLLSTVLADRGKCLILDMMVEVHSVLNVLLCLAYFDTALLVDCFLSCLVSEWRITLDIRHTFSQQKAYRN